MRPDVTGAFLAAVMMIGGAVIMQAQIIDATT